MKQWLLEKGVRALVPALLGAVIALLLAAGLLDAELAGALQEVLSNS